MKALLETALAGSLGLCRAGALAVATALVLWPAPATSQNSMQLLAGHVPLAVSRLNLQPLGLVERTNQINLAIGLPLRNRETLSNLLDQIYDPVSPNYHQFLTPEQFAEKFGPTEKDYQAVAAFAQANGLTVKGTHPNRLLLDVNGAVNDVENALHVTLRKYQHPTENRTFFAPDTDPSVPAGLQIQSVIGLDNYSLPHPKFVPSPLTNAAPNAGSGPGSNYMGQDFRAAYVPGVTLTGSGQVVGLLQFDGYYLSDTLAYELSNGLPNVNITNIYLDGYDGTPSGNGGEVEVALDIEMVISMAPGISKLILYEAGPFGFPADILSRMATDNEAKQISCSWGWSLSEGPRATTDSLFLELAAQGQTFFDASGDSDAFLPGEADALSPSSSPYITQVGGTTLKTSGPRGAYASETVWNRGNGFGSSGGISSFYNIPAYQQGISMANNGGSTTKRNIPDVALTADNVFVIAENGLQGALAGTSCAAPLWAGFMALVNQQGATLGKSPLGFINPLLYSIGRGSAYVACFHDITVGSNAWAASPNAFFAKPGYDLCTGWGTPNGQNLINAMLSLTGSGVLQMSVNPPSGAALIGSLNQSVFATVSDVFAVNNATVLATVPGIVTNLLLRNDGISPDVTAGDNISSGTFQAPASGPFTMTVMATAPKEVGITNTLYYMAIPVPQNDNFVSATKVPAAGGVYLSNNRFATIEAGETNHDGATTRAASLWWDWTAPDNGNLFVDTRGSAINLVLAIYTGTTLPNLVQVAATNNVGAAHGVFLNINAVPGTTYHIVVAGFNSTSLGSIHLGIVPGGTQDTNAPTLLVASPLSGLWVTNRFVAFSGTANDPQPGATGLSQVNLTVNNLIANVANQWQFTANGTTNWNSFVALTPGLNHIKVTAQDLAGNVSVPVNVELTLFSLGPANDLFANAIPLTGNSGAVSGSNTNATKEFGEPEPAGNPGGKSLWWSFTPPSDGVLTLDTSGSSFDTVMGLYLGANVANLTTIAANDDAAPFIISSLISQAVKSNQVYHIAVDGYNGASGYVALTYSFTPATLHQLTVAPSVGGVVQVTTTNSAGGTAIMPGLVGNFADNTPISLTGLPDAYSQFTRWIGSITSSNNPLSLIILSNLDMAAQFGSFPFTDGFESGDLSHLSWVTFGDAPWFVQPTVVLGGLFAARSGIIGDNQSSSLMLSTNFAAGLGSFDFRISSETNFDFLNFSVDGVLLQRWSGEIEWENFSFPLTAGAHVLQWTYAKDPSLSSGLDAAFVDDVNLPLALPPANPTPAHLQLSRQGDGSLVLDLQGGTNQQYILQTSTDLVNWVNVSTNTAVGGLVRLPVPSGTNQAQFYRAKIAP